MKVCKLLLSLSAVVAVLLATASPADAVFRMRVEDLGAGVGTVITDNGALDGSSLADVILFSGTVGAFTVSVQVGTASPGVPFPGFFDAIDLNNVSVSTSGPGTLRIILEKDGFTGAPDGWLNLESKVGGVLAGPAGSSITLRSWGNDDNLIPALGPDQGVGAIAPIVFPPPPAGSVATPPLVFTTSPFSGVATAPFFKTGTYSLFSEAVIVLSGAGSTSFDHTTGTTPAPAGLLLLAAGAPCLALGYFRRKKAAPGVMR